MAGAVKKVILYLTLILLTLFWAVPTFIEDRFKERLAECFVHGLSIDAAEGVNFSYWKGFSVERLVVHVKSEVGGYSAELKGVELGVAARSFLHSAEMITLNDISLKKLTIRSRFEKDNGRLRGIGMVKKSLIGVDFSERFALLCDTVSWGDSLETTAISEVSLKRIGERDFELACHGVKHRGHLKSGYVEIEVFNLREGSNDTLGIQIPELSSLLPRTGKIEALTASLESQLKCFEGESVDLLADTLLTAVKKSYSNLFSVLEFDSVSVHNSLMSIRNSDEKLSELVWWSCVWKRDSLNQISLKMPSVRDQKYGAVDSLVVEMLFDNELVLMNRISFQKNMHRIVFDSKTPECSDSGRIDLRIFKQGKRTLLHGSVLPFEFNALKLSLDGKWTKSGAWDLFLTGGIRNCVLDNFLPRSSFLRGQGVVIDSVFIRSLKMNSHDINISLGGFKGVLDTIPVEGEKVQFHLNGQKALFEKLKTELPVFKNEQNSIVVNGLKFEWEADSTYLSAQDIQAFTRHTKESFIALKQLEWIRLLSERLSNTLPELSQDKQTIHVNSLVLNGVNDELASISNLQVKRLKDSVDIEYRHFGMAGLGIGKQGVLSLDISQKTPQISSVKMKQFHFGGDRSGIFDTIPGAVSVFVREYRDFLDTDCSVNLGYLSVPGVLTHGRGIRLDLRKRARSFKYDVSSKNMVLKDIGRIVNTKSSGMIHSDRVEIDSILVHHKGMKAYGAGWVKLKKGYPCALEVKASNIKLSKISQKLLKHNGLVTGAGAGALSFKGALLNPDSWKGEGSFTLTNVRVRNLSMQQGELIDKYAAPFKDISFSKIRCNPFDLNTGLKAHMKHVYGNGGLLNFKGWGNLTQSGYFYFEMSGKVHGTTMEQLPKLTRLALNERSRKDEGSFRIKMAGTPESQQIIPEKGLGGKVVRSYFRNIGASFQKFFN